MDFKHLALLIGTNPLPNYVTAAHLIEKVKELKFIWLIHTAKTNDIAQRLAEVLKKKFSSIEIRFCGLEDPGKALFIRKNIEELILSKISRNDKLHLNYTGGTKNMVVHGYLAFQTSDLEIENLSFSYLDTHDFNLKFDDGSYTSDDLRKLVSIQFEDLLALHDCHKKPSEKQIKWYDANKVIHEFIEQEIILDFIKWKRDIIRPIFYDQRGRLVRPNRVNRKEFRPDHPFFINAFKLIKNFPAEQAWHFDKEENLIIPDSKSAFDDQKGDFVQGIRYLDGFWLEFYIIEILARHIDKDKLNLKLMANTRMVKGAARKDFEIDVMLLNGYQLCGITVTTDDSEGRCKSKAFEILHRSQQIGGEEARSILVAPLIRPVADKIEADLKVDLGGAENFCIAGLEDLPEENLWKKVKEHIFRRINHG
ncbi:hypothetical protein JW964_06240 [candidate division KSB1 bacterium]|nr:hypothetical protein [candidate division KSB1 bacterium]